MSVQALTKIHHNGKEYHCGDTILDITKEEAERLEKIDAGKIIDDKFKESKKKVRQRIISQNRRWKKKEGEYIYAQG